MDWGVRVSDRPHKLIRASAGAGKTYRLTTRYLALLAADADPGAVLATTFTRKAAGEVFGRVMLRLAHAAGDEAALAELNQALVDEPIGGQARVLSRSQAQGLLAALAESLHRVGVMTIDGFFARLVRVFALELGLPSEVRVLDDESAAAAELRRQAIEAMLDEAVRADGLAAVSALLRQVHHDQAARRVGQALDDLVKQLHGVYREAEDAALWCGPKVEGLLDEAGLRTAAEGLAGLEAVLPVTKAGKPMAVWVKAMASLVAALHANDWEAVLDNGLVAKIVVGEASYSKKEIPSEFVRAIEPIAKHAGAERVQLLARQTQAMHVLLQAYDGHLAALLRARRLARFSDLTDALARGLPAMGDAAEALYYRLDGRVHHLLVDEFQDTSLQQWAVMSPMVEELTAHGTFERTGFFVGDTKQSIYGWRGGRVELFDRVEEELEARGLEVERLDQSWRSSPVVLGLVNAVMGRVGLDGVLKEQPGAVERWAQAFEDHTSAKRGMTGHAVVEVLPTVSEEAEEGQDVFFEAVAERVVGMSEELAGRGKLAVLVRRRESGRKLVHALRAQGVAATLEGGAYVTDSPAVLAVLAALTLADHPGDTVAAFHVANSPMGEVLGMRGTAWAETQRVAGRVRRRLVEEGLATVLADWSAALGPMCDAKGAARLAQLQRLVESAEGSGLVSGLRPSGFVRYAESVRVEEAGQGTAGVVVMTIHAAKGLEFDAVVLADLHGAFQDRQEFVTARDEPTGPVRAVYRAGNKAVRAMSPEVEAAFAEHVERQRYEDLCGLYVAMTRAKRGLYVWLPGVGVTKSGKPGSRRASLGKVVLESLGAADEVGVVYEEGDAAWMKALGRPHEQAGAQEAAGSVTLSLGKGWGRSPRVVAASSLEGGSEEPATAAALLRIGGGGGMAYGTAMHGLFEQLGFVEDGLPERAAILQAAGGDEAVLERFEAVYQEPTIRKALSRGGASGVWREKALMVKAGRERVIGRADRVVYGKDETGRVRWARVEDFKTDVVADDAGLAEKIGVYRPQLAAYRKAVAAWLGLSDEAVSGRLIFVGASVQTRRVVDL